MLERRLFRRKSTGEVIDPDWLQFSFPTWWHYDVLRGLDYLRDAGVEPDDRVAEAIEIVEGNRDADGRWPLQNVHEGEVPVRDGGRRGRAEPLEHAPRTSRARLVHGRVTEGDGRRIGGGAGPTARPRSRTCAGRAGAWSRPPTRTVARSSAHCTMASSSISSHSRSICDAWPAWSRPTRWQRGCSWTR